MNGIDPRALRDAFGAFATGVTVVTSRNAEGAPIGFTANSFASVSLDPPLLLICLAKTSRNYASMTSALGFAVNVLAEDQKEVSNTFARPVEDRFAAVDWREGPAGSPVFPGAAAWFDCTVEKIVEAGDHAILIGRIAAFENSGRSGLGYVRGAYFMPGLDAKALQAAGGRTMVAAVVERGGAVLLVPEGDAFALPSIAVAEGDPVQALEAHLLAETGLRAHAGFLFSVYEDRASGCRHIVYCASAGDGNPREGRFFPLAELPLDRVASAQAADILRRFATESEIGNFGVYVGDETAGRVHALAGKARQP